MVTFLSSILIIPGIRTLDSSLNRKPTYCGLTAKFNPYIPIKYKGNMISTLIQRTFAISKDYLIFSTKKVDYITNILRENHFPINFFECNIKKAFDRNLVPDEPLVPLFKDLIYIKLLSLGTICYQFKRKLSS